MANLPNRSSTSRLLRLLPVVLLVLPLAGTAEAGGTKGKVTGSEKLLPQVYVDASKLEAHRYTWREPSPTVKKEFRDLTANPTRDVCIVALSSNAASKHDDVTVNVTGGRTYWSSLVVSPGTKIVFLSRDPFAHRLYLNGNESFKVEETLGDGRREWTAPSQGSYKFLDKNFPSLKLTVLVEPGAVDFTFPNRAGAYSFSNLPVGDYVMRAYFEGKAVGKPAPVGVKASGGEVKETINLGEASP
ncbi:hypothetical protein BH09MYX1_BH09MYX1_34700 [soil metagenome]